MKRIIATALAVFLLLPATTALAQEADKKPSGSGVTLLTSKTAAVMRGETAWLAINWTATNGDFDDLQVTLKKVPKGIEIVYPGYGSSTSLYNDASLSDAELDRTSFQIIVPADFSSSDITLTAEVTYLADGKKVKDKHDVVIPVVDHSGADLQLVTNATTVPESGWVGIRYAGLAPALTDFSLVINNLPVEYPGYGSATSLWNDSTLQSHETDVARFYVDPTMAPGPYPLEVTVTYNKAGVRHTLESTIDLTVGG